MKMNILSVLVIALACASYLPEASAVICDEKRMDGDKTMPGAPIVRYSGFSNVASGKQCLEKYCAPRTNCKTAVYSPKQRKCFLYSKSPNKAKPNRNKYQKNLEVWYCKGGAQRTPALSGPQPKYSSTGVKRTLSGRKPNQGRLAFKATCTKLVTTRLDPIVSPNTFSGHVHNIFGNEHFSATVTKSDLNNNAMTTCNFPQDRSMYWSPALYGKLKDGSLYLIPSFIQAYYHTTGIDDDLYTFPKGLKILVGDAYRKGGPGYSPQDREDATPNWHCHTSGGVDNDAYSGFPGLRTRKGRACTMWQARMFYPSCWDGKNLDSADHFSHMAYPYKRRCPASHPFQVPQLKMETVFRLKPYFKKLGRQAKLSDFVLANGDSHGASMHSDYISGWDESDMAGMLKRCEVARGGGCALDQFRKRVVEEGTYKMRNPKPQEEVAGMMKLPKGAVKLAM